MQELTVYTDVYSLRGQAEHRQKVHSEGPCQNVVHAKINGSTKSCRITGLTTTVHDGHTLNTTSASATAVVVKASALMSSKFYQDEEEEAGHTRRKGARDSPAPPRA